MSITVETSSLLGTEDPQPDDDRPTELQKCCRAIFSWGVRVKFSLFAFFYFLIGTIVYYCAEHPTKHQWTLEESFFYAMSIGLSEGFTVVVATTNFTEFWTGFYMVVGQSLIIGGILIGMDILIEEVEQSYRIAVPFYQRKAVICT
jgi:hypothetical protein